MLAEHHRHLVTTGALRRRQSARAQAAVESVVVERLRRALAGPDGQARLGEAARAVTAGATDHHRAADDVLTWLRGAGAAWLHHP
jgi:hypothetical protein